MLLVNYLTLLKSCQVKPKPRESIIIARAIGAIDVTISISFRDTKNKSQISKLIFFKKIIFFLILHVDLYLLLGLN